MSISYLNTGDKTLDLIINDWSQYVEYLYNENLGISNFNDTKAALNVYICDCITQQEFDHPGMIININKRAIVSLKKQVNTILADMTDDTFTNDQKSTIIYNQLKDYYDFLIANNIDDKHKKAIEKKLENYVAGSRWISGENIYNALKKGNLNQIANNRYILIDRFIEYKNKLDQIYTTTLINKNQIKHINKLKQSTFSSATKQELMKSSLYKYLNKLYQKAKKNSEDDDSIFLSSSSITMDDYYCLLLYLKIDSFDVNKSVINKVSNGLDYDTIRQIYNLFFCSNNRSGKKQIKDIYDDSLDTNIKTTTNKGIIFEDISKIHANIKDNPDLFDNYFNNFVCDI